jgi:nucleotide-binding universal stress UspA family protein
VGQAPLDLSGKSVLLASDGSPASDSATLFALALATKHGARIHVISVVETRSVPIPPPLDLAIAMTDATVGSAVHEQQVNAVRAMISATTMQRVDWPIRVALGTPAATIVQEAKRIEAALIIMGLRRHGRFDRAVNDETALSAMRTAACPVLAVVPGATELPTRVLAAIDFSRGSLAAARAAQSMLGPGGTILLAYVPPPRGFIPDDGEAVVHELGVAAGFARCECELSQQGTRVDHVVAHREVSRSVAATLLDQAEAANADLIAVGSARHGRLDRWMLGSVSTDLVRDGRRSVLCVPP